MKVPQEFPMMPHMTGFQLLLELLSPSEEEKKTDPVCVDLGNRKVELHFNYNDRARRYLLYVRSDGSVSVTIPRRGSRKRAIEFANSHKAWISRRLHRIEAQPILPTQWHLGMQFILNGEKVFIEKKIIHDTEWLAIGTETFPFPSQATDLRPYIEACMIKFAKHTLPERVQQLADEFSIPIKKVTIRDQSSRWGSCSRRGTISLNWRLVQMPPAARDYIIIHELMHVREMNHSSRFWTLVQQACPLYRQHEQWIKTHAAQLGM